MSHVIVAVAGVLAVAVAVAVDVAVAVAVAIAPAVNGRCHRSDPRASNCSHNLGSNSGGLYKGVYLARSCDMINKDTGEPFKARDFHIGSVTKLPSVSLEVRYARVGSCREESFQMVSLQFVHHALCASAMGLS